MKKSSIGITIKSILSCITGLGICLSVVNYLVSACNTTYWDEITLAISILLFLSGWVWVNKHVTSSFDKLISLATLLKDQQYEIKEFKSQSKEANEIATILIGMAEEIHTASVFIKNIEEGNIDINYTIHSESTSSQSILSKSLISMRDKMKLIALEEKERNWGTEGLARFVEILRATQLDVKDLANEIISKLVKYINANQGGIFIYQDEGTPHLELVACYAYDRKKFINKTIEIGEGLVGQCFLEKDIIYLTEIPANYVNVTSGLGQATPKCLLIVPLMVNEEVFGIMEIASFHELKKYQIDFVKKLGESIASTISNVQVNDSTKKMLQQSQVLGEQMKSQEEELRQNMEELSATQEEMIRKEKLIQGLLSDSIKNEEALKEKLQEINTLKEEDKAKTEKMLQEIEQNRNLLTKVIDELPEKIFLKDEEGRFIVLNSAIAAGYNKSISELIGTSDFDNFDHSLAKEWRKDELAIIASGTATTIYEDFPDADGNIHHLYTVKQPFHFVSTDKIGILGYQVDITEIKVLEKKIKESEQSFRLKEDVLLNEVKEKQKIIEKQQRKIINLEANNL